MQYFNIRQRRFGFDPLWRFFVGQACPPKKPKDIDGEAFRLYNQATKQKRRRTIMENNENKIMREGEKIMDERQVTISQHAAERLKERVGLKSEERRKRWAEKAYMTGRRKSDSKGVYLKYIESVDLYDEVIEILIYQDHLCLFNETQLVTVYPLDEYYSKIMQKHRSKINGNEKSRWQYCYEDVA